MGKIKVYCFDAYDILYVEGISPEYFKRLNTFSVSQDGNVSSYSPCIPMETTGGELDDVEIGKCNVSYELDDPELVNALSKIVDRVQKGASKIVTPDFLPPKLVK